MCWCCSATHVGGTAPQNEYVSVKWNSDIQNNISRDLDKKPRKARWPERTYRLRTGVFRAAAKKKDQHTVVFSSNE